MESAFKRARRGESGGALVELATLSTILVVLAAGAVDFGKYTYDGIILANAAEAGVLYGSQNYTGTASDLTAMQTAATNDASGVSVSPTASEFCACYNGASNTSVGTTFSCSTSPLPSPCGTTGYHELTFVQVLTTGTFTPLFRYPGLPTTITISRTAVMEVPP